MCPKLANLLEIFISKFTESINIEQAIFLDYFSAELGSSHCHPLLLSMSTSGSEEFIPVPSAGAFSLQHRQLLLCLLGCAPCMGTTFGLGPMEEGLFSLPQRAAALSLCLLGSSQGRGLERAARRRQKTLGSCSTSVAWGGVPTMGSTIFPELQKTSNQYVQAWELPGQWHQPLNSVLLLKHIPPPALCSTPSRGDGLGSNSMPVR